MTLRIPTVPIDDAARNGGYQFVAGDSYFAIARWDGEAWRFPNGRELPFTVLSYRPPPEREIAA